jgi:hypothetical protein
MIEDLPNKLELFCNETPLVFPNGCYISAGILFGVIGFFALFVWK